VRRVSPDGPEFSPPLMSVIQSEARASFTLKDQRKEWLRNYTSEISLSARRKKTCASSLRRQAQLNQLQ
jgi:hypothetical protein